MRILIDSVLGFFLIHPCLHPPSMILFILPVNPGKWIFLIAGASINPLETNKTHQICFLYGFRYNKIRDEHWNKRGFVFEFQHYRFR